MTLIRSLGALALCVLLSACETSGFSSSQTRQANYRCSGGVTLSIRREGAGVRVTDSRGIEAAMPASPSGQNTRYAEGIHALILEKRDATWFVSGQTPAVCRR